jgi:hypothetical protein
VHGERLAVEVAHHAGNLASGVPSDLGSGDVIPYRLDGIAFVVKLILLEPVYHPVR